MASVFLLPNVMKAEGTERRAHEHLYCVTQGSIKLGNGSFCSSVSCLQAVSTLSLLAGCPCCFHLVFLRPHGDQRCWSQAGTIQKC